MGKGRLRTTDYNTETRLLRTTKWWLAPEGVSRKSRAISGIFLATILAAALLVGIMRWFADDTAPEPTSAAAQQAQEQAQEAVPAVEPVCPEAAPEVLLPEQIMDFPLTPTWVRDGDMLRPVSATGGPGLETPFPQCFSRNPEGALYAASNFATGAISSTATGDHKEFYSLRLSHTGSYNALISSLADATPAENRPTVSISGYRWNSYSPTLVSLELRFTLMSGPRAGTASAIPYTLSWENNDWLIVPPNPSDNLTADPNRPYIPWGGTA